DTVKSNNELEKAKKKSNRQILDTIKVLKNEQKQLESIRPALERAKDATESLRDVGVNIPSKNFKFIDDLKEAESTFQGLKASIDSVSKVQSVSDESFFGK